MNVAGSVTSNGGSITMDITLPDDTVECSASADSSCSGENENHVTDRVIVPPISLIETEFISMARFFIRVQRRRSECDQLQGQDLWSHWKRRWTLLPFCRQSRFNYTRHHPWY